MYLYVYLCAFICIHMYNYVCVHIYVYTHTHTHTQAFSVGGGWANKKSKLVWRGRDSNPLRVQFVDEIAARHTHLIDAHIRCCSVLQRVAACCSVLQCVAVTQIPLHVKFVG